MMEIDFGRLVEAHLLREREMEGKRTRSRTNNASELGDPCLRKLCYKRLSPEMATPFDGATLARFELGNLLERHIKRLLIEAGVEVMHAQISRRWEAYNISGHIDGVVSAREFERAAFRLGIEGGIPPMAGQVPAVPTAGEAERPDELIVVEIKGLNPNTFRAINAPGDFLEYAWWTRRYLVQMVLYLWLEELERGMFLIFDKSGAGIKTIEVRRDEWIGLAEEALQAAEEIERVVAANSDMGAEALIPPTAGLPPQINNRAECEMCEFQAFCGPTLSYGPGTEIIEDDTLFALLERRDELDEARTEYKHVDEEVKRWFALPEDAREAGWLVTRTARGDVAVLANEIAESLGGIPPMAGQVPAAPTDTYQVTAKRSRDGSVRKTIQRLGAADEDEG